MNDSLLILILTAFVGAIAWVIRFAINEYEIYKKFGVSSTIFKYGGFYLMLFLAWSISARTVYSKIINFIPADKIKDVDKELSFVMADKYTIYAMVAFFFFVWFFSTCITSFAKFINDERKYAKK